MEIRIGIKDSAREISFLVSEKEKDIEDKLQQAVQGGDKPLILKDEKSNEYLIPIKNISYIVKGSNDKPKVGFIS